MNEQEKLEYEIKLEAAKKAGLQKEVKRLEKEPFKTMSEVLNTDTLDELRGWKEPQGAYILFETLVRNLTPEGAVLKHSLFTLGCENRPEIKEKIYYYTRKGYRPIHYANFPELNDANPSRVVKLKLHMGSTQVNPWRELKAVLNNIMNKDSGNTNLIKEKRGLEDKLAEARLELARVKKGSKVENTNA